ncbi:MAG: biosynthetic-type acetolactate synthase large subunit [Lachnospiraceae bacterium]|nr:biosynthetic-type acetolactate synthase large subunit [Lachnospiraceae bacterium]MBQ1993469.1 biosynthetic-type acetolactate synthase large subunit [Lachnospiraceae bacterium]MBQ2117219.1 biosynthetic-type acetolactate synthase large subunit [Lachnospiraceae bacterium]MBQ2407234.1 biosynthetic-type acetolactate synthase large subunit [Lachnospiraceae bacterium]MBQ5851793.1 biosynthetic-type acetolactate synthase large subunit [Lachnospiraceae bacterium]
MIGADAMIKCLENEGVTTVYGYPGVAITPFYNSILDSDIRTILVRTEQNAAHAASGEARVTGKIGVCAVTSGPGATNLITGIATAFADSIPMICITGQVKSEQIGSDVFQEADITGAVESFVKYSYLVKKVEDIPRIFKEAFYIANTGRKGPVLIDVPIDVQNATIRNFKYPEEVNLRTYKPTVKGHAVQIKKVIKELSKAKRPIICAGGGVHLSGAVDELREFVHKYRIPVVTTMMGIGVMPTQDPMHFGMVGNNGLAYANRAMNESDLIIMVGARVADRAISQPDLITANKVLVHIDVDPAEIGKNAGPSIPLVGDAKHIFKDFAKQEFECEHEEWIKTLEEYRDTMGKKRNPDKDYVDPAEFIKLLSDEMQDNAVYVADVGQNQIWSCNYHIVKDGRFLTSGGMGTMGYSIPAAMGAKIGDRSRQVVAVCGDGSFQMSMMELATIMQHDIPVKIIVMKNNYLGMVRQYQHFTYKDNYSVVDIKDGTPNLEKLSAAYDIPFIRVENMSDAKEKIQAFLKEDCTMLMECIVDPMDLV